MIKTEADFIKRLNILLKLPQVDLALVDNGAWSKLLDELHWALLGKKDRNFVPGEVQTTFHWNATRAGVKAAQDGLRSQLAVLQRSKPQDAAAKFNLEEHQMYILAGAKGFEHLYHCDDFPTMVYSMLPYLLERSRVKQSDLLTCSNEGCRKMFVPLRKRDKSKRAFCSPKCANLIAAREYRKSKAEELKKQERQRSKKRYRKRVLKT